jgi:hypothetical protein
LACSGKGEPADFAIDAADIYPVDFVGHLVAADLSAWDVAQSGTFPTTIEFTRGGPRSEILVGPATFTLGDGRVIDIAPGTPGGNQCELLDPNPTPTTQVCVVMGAFHPGTTTAAWFTAVLQTPVAGGFMSDSIGVDDHVAMLSVGLDTWTSLPIPRGTPAKCPDAMPFERAAEFASHGFAATIDFDGTIIGLECLADM